MRVQLALNVNNLEQAIDYYSKLFGAEPHKVRDGYANFALQSPPLKLVLFENPGAKERLNHLGIEVDKAEQIATAKARLTKDGILDEVQNNETCCHATQNKLWSREPDGLRWEWYQITDDAPEVSKQASRCCNWAANCCQQASACCGG
ncbi:MAG: ArsI/CadI family heavy metal resistance metalloenzyme [Candidatus Reddybacter sp.]